LTTDDKELLMGLAERRSVLRFENDDYPAFKARIDEVAGFEVHIEVAWDELAAEDYADSYAQFFPMVYFEPLISALSAVCIDDLGKNALRDGLSKIIVRNTDEHSSESGISFTDGVLTFDHKPQTNVDYGADRAKALQHALEKGL
jgi:hypothetical protein